MVWVIIPILLLTLVIVKIVSNLISRHLLSKYRENNSIIVESACGLNIKNSIT